MATPQAPVILLFGGASSERLVSVASAQNVSRFLPDAEPWFLTKTGAIYVVPKDKLAAHTDAFQTEFEQKGPAAFPSLDVALASEPAQGATFFLALHGGEGENGVLQGKLEQKGLAFTGSGAKASADAFDKARAKSLAEKKGARVASAVELHPMKSSTAEPNLLELLKMHPRWVLKPAADGSSHGLVHLRRPQDVVAAAAKLEQVHVRYLAEEFIEGRELTVGVMEEGPSQVALPVSEVKLEENAAFDYAGKYLGKGTQEITPAVLTQTEWEQAQSLALLAHRAVGCYGYTRTDMILTPQGPVFLEINTLPGLTRASFIPQQLAASGRDLGFFLNKQLELARTRPSGR